MSSTDSQPQVESIDIGGRFYADAVAVCEDGPFGRTSHPCLRDGRRRWLYARPASQAFADVQPTLLATGRHLDARYLKLSPDGTKITWRQAGKLRSRSIGP